MSSTFTVMADGAPIAIDPTATVTVQLYTITGTSSLSQPRAVVAGADGADWANGVVSVDFTPIELAALQPPWAMLVIVGPGFVKRFKVDVSSANVVEQSQLFIKDFAIDEIRRDRLTLLAQSIFGGVTLSDDYIWSKLVAAESETASDLRVPLVPTQFFAIDPTPAQIAALPANMPWAIDPAQDYEPDFFQGEKWGFMVLRNKPVISVQQVQFVYPSPTQGFFDFPLDWIRIDKKYAQIRFVPASSTFVAPLNAFLLQALGGGRTIPFAFNVTYVAGITDARTTYPQLIDVIKRRAVLKIVEDGFLPSSGSISADGLSQSMSIDMDKYRDTINTTLFGPKGSNGGLQAAIHGIRMYSLGN